MSVRRAPTNIATARETEADFRRAVCDLATLHGWRWVYFPDSRTVQGAPGLPDLLLTRHGRLLFVELKTQTGRVRAEQHAWLAALAATAAETYIWRPSDWRAIEARLG